MKTVVVISDATGDTAERVVRTAPCPVFVARAKEHELV